MDIDARERLGTPTESDTRQLAGLLAALAHPARIEIIQHLARAESCCCREVVEKFDLAQSTVSQHLKILVDAGLVKFAPDKRRSRYEIDRVALAGLSASVSGLAMACCASRAA